MAANAIPWKSQTGKGSDTVQFISANLKPEIILDAGRWGKNVWVRLDPGSHEEKQILNNQPPEGRIVYKIKNAGVFPHIIVQAEASSKLRLLNAHLTPEDGGGPHMNPHTWFYHGDAMFVDAVSWQSISKSDIQADCSLFGQFLYKLFKLSILKILVKEDVGARTFRQLAPSDEHKLNVL